MHIILPDQEHGDGPFPVFYLLNGIGSDFTGWMRFTNIERYAQHLPLIVVMPNAERSFYCDAIQGMKYEEHVIQDVIGFVDSRFNTIASREGRVTGGLSMGGYGALKLAFKFPHMFCSAVSHSGILHITVVESSDYPELDEPTEEARAEFQRVFGSSPAGGKDCLFALAEGIDRTLLPNIRFDCGLEDQPWILDGSRRFHAHLESLNIPHEYEEFPGGHDWEYWDLHVKDAIAFHQRCLHL